MQLSVIRNNRLPSSEQTTEKLEQRLRKKTSKAISDFDLISEGDHIMVCISGGKDSYALLDVLLELQKRSPVSFTMTAVNVDQGWPGYDTPTIEAHLKTTGVRYEMITESFASIVESKLKPGATPCSLCSRLRRGVLYGLADKFGCNKLALGHHRDDLIETLILNVFYGGKISSMPPKLFADNGRHIVIRPMAYVPEDLLEEWSLRKSYPVVRCGCPSCGLPEQKRQQVKRLLTELEKDSPQIKDQMLASLSNVRPSHLLDKTLTKSANNYT